MEYLTECLLSLTFTEKQRPTGGNPPRLHGEELLHQQLGMAINAGFLLPLSEDTLQRVKLERYRPEALADAPRRAVEAELERLDGKSEYRVHLRFHPHNSEWTQEQLASLFQSAFQSATNAGVFGLLCEDDPKVSLCNVWASTLPFVSE